MKASELAYKSAEYMAEHGHCKRILFNAQGNVCFLGAMEMVNNQEQQSGVWGSYNLIAEAAGFSSVEAVVNFNNAEDTTGEDVILVFKKAGAKLESEGR